MLLYEGIEAEGDPYSTMSHGTLQQPLIVFNCPFANYPAYTNRSCVAFSDIKPRKAKREEHGLADDDVIEHFLNFGFTFGSSINNRRFVGPSVPFYQVVTIPGARSHAKSIRQCKTHSEIQVEVIWMHTNFDPNYW